MSGEVADLLIVALEKTEASTIARFRVKNAWAYHWQGDVKLVLRVTDKGHVLRHTDGPQDDPDSYRTFFTTFEGARAQMAFSTEPQPLSEADVSARLESVTVRRTAAYLSIIVR